MSMPTQRMQDLGNAGLNSALNLTTVLFQGAARLLDIQMQATKNLARIQSKSSKAMFGTPDWSEFISGPDDFFQVSTEQALDFVRQANEVVAEIQSELSQAMEQRSSEFAQEFSSNFEEAKRTADQSWQESRKTLQDAAQRSKDVMSDTAEKAENAASEALGRGRKTG